MNPINVYGKSKAEGERLLRNVLSPHVILRTSWVFSKRGKNIVKTIRRLAKKHDFLKIVDDQLSRPTSADCVAKILLSITSKYIESGTFPWGTYHYAGSPIVSWYEFAQAILKNEDKCYSTKLILCSSVEYKTKAMRPKFSVMSTELIKIKLGALDCDWFKELQS